jgi:drug/metabolite transporter (DMT)-like permease
VPVFGIIMGVLFYDEKIGLLTGIGIAIIIFGLLLVNSASLFSYSVFQNYMLRLKSKNKRN